MVSMCAQRTTMLYGCDGLSHPDVHDRHAHRDDRSRLCALQVEGPQPLQDRIVAQILRPAVGGEDGAVAAAVGEVEPDGALDQGPEARSTRWIKTGR